MVDKSAAANIRDKLLSHEETLKLIVLAQAGNEQAQETLVRSNMALVKSIVKKFLGRGVEFDDLFQIGSLGLIKAIQNFKMEYNVRFSTYAVPLIAGEIKRFLRDDGMVKVSRSLKELATKATAVEQQLKLDFDREPTVNEIAEVLHVDAEELVLAQDAMRTHISLQEPVFEDNGTSLLEMIESQEDQGEKWTNSIVLKELIGKLEPRDRKIIIMRYFQDKTQTEIAQQMGVSQVQVSRLESRIIKTMKEAMLQD